MNTGAPVPDLAEARARVLHVGRKLHERAASDAERRFHDLWNLRSDEATIAVAWSRVSQNRGSWTAGVDAFTRYHIEHRFGVERFLTELRGELKEGRFRPSPVRERAIPKRGGSLRYLGIPTLKDRVVQMALKLVLEPIFEADFYPSSYGYRVGRRAQDAIAEIVHFTRDPSGYEWVVEADIEACFDRIDHGQLMVEVARRVGNRRVLRLVRAFLKARVMREGGRFERTLTGTPQGGIVSRLLANIALNALDRRYAADWADMSRYQGRRRYLHLTGHPTFRLVRFADDLVVLVKGTRAQAEAVLGGLGERVAFIGLRLKPDEDRAHPYRRGPHVPRPADHPPSQGTQPLRLHARRERGTGLGHATREDPHQAVHDPAGPRRAVACAEPGPPWLGGLLPLRRGQADPRLPALVCLVAGHPLASQEAPAVDVAAGPATHLRQGCDPGGRADALRPGGDARGALSLPGRAHLDPVE